MRSLVVVLSLTLVATHAHANGRPAQVRSLHFRAGSMQHVAAGLTLGLATSDDGGATWRWMCEPAVGYGGVFDPDYAYADAGALFATTTVNGLRVNRDGCTFESTTLGAADVSQIELAPSGALLAALSDATDARIVTSSDVGQTFPAAATPGIAGDWWQSLAVAPSDAQRVYVTGYRIVNGARVLLLFTSDDGGAAFTAMSTAGLQLSASSLVSIVGVSPSTPTTVYALVSFENGTVTDGIYVSTDAGASWTRMLGAPQPLAFLARGNGDLVVASPSVAKVSTTGGASWTDLVAPPPITCLVERANGEVWACTTSFTGGDVIMKSIDLATWTGVLRWKDLAGPVACPAGTVQHDTCGPQWCTLRSQFGITADPTDCASHGGPVDGLIDAGPRAPHDAAIAPPSGGTGCCDTGGSAGSLVPAAALVALLGGRRRRRLGVISYRA